MPGCASAFPILPLSVILGLDPRTHSSSQKKNSNAAKFGHSQWGPRVMPEDDRGLRMTERCFRQRSKISH